MTVYVDVLLAVNLYVTFLLLLATERWSHARYGRLRRILASGIGAASGLLVLLPEPHWSLLLLSRIGIALAIVAVASGERRWRPLLAQTALFFAVSALFAGTVLLLSLWQPGFFAVRNGAPVVNLDVWTLLSVTTLTWIALRLFEWIRSRRGAAERLRVTLRSGVGSVALNCIADTGSSLREPFSGLPAAVCRVGAVGSLLTPEQRESLPALLAGVPPDSLPVCPGLRLIPGRTILGTALLPAFGPVDLLLEGRAVSVWAAVCRDASLPHTDAILPAEILR